MFDFRIAILISQFHPKKTPVVILYEDIMNSFGDICIKLSPQSFLYCCRAHKTELAVKARFHAASSQLLGCP